MLLCANMQTCTNKAHNARVCKFSVHWTCLRWSSKHTHTHVLWYGCPNRYLDIAMLLVNTRSQVCRTQQRPPPHLLSSSPWCQHWLTTRSSQNGVPQHHNIHKLPKYHNMCKVPHIQAVQPKNMCATRCWLATAANLGSPTPGQIDALNDCTL